MSDDRISHNYHQPKEQLCKKEALIGPVTAIALPSFAEHESCVSMVSKGPWVELTVNNTTYRHLLFDEGGTIHGFDQMRDCGKRKAKVGHELRDLWFFYGGRCLSFAAIDMKIMLSPKFSSDPRNPFTLLKTPSGKMIRLSDWIWDVRALTFVNECSDSDEDFRILTAVGLSHNTVELWSFTHKSVDSNITPCCLRKIICGDRCITYSLSFFGWKEDYSIRTCLENGIDLVVATGTVSNEVLLWSVLDNEEGMEIMTQLASTDPTCNVIQKKIHHRLSGHDGVIYSVRFGCGGKSLVSTSDDRTIRLWKQEGISKELGTNTFETSIDARMLKDQAYNLLWVGYGHTGRVWDSCFVTLPTENNLTLSSGAVASVGEDATIRVWGFEDGREIGRFKIHGCKSIWKIASNFSGNTIITGGNDGISKLVDVRYLLFSNPSLMKRIFLPADNIEISDNREVKHEDDKIPLQQGKVKKQKKIKTRQHHKQVVCGINFYPSKPSADAKVLVATRAGMLHTICLNSGETIVHGSWAKVSSLEVHSHEELIDSASGTCIAMHPEQLSVAIGNSKGQIVVCSIKDFEHENRIVFAASGYLAIQSLQWLDSLNLLAFHIKGICVLWTFTNSDIDSVHGKPQIRAILSLSRDGLVAGIPKSCYFDKMKNELFIGDSRGNIGVFCLGDDAWSGNVMYAVDILSFSHKKEYVTGIIPIANGHGIISAGNDGYIHQIAVIRNQNGRCTKLQSIIRKPSQLSGISHIWQTNLNGNPDSIVVGGYHGNDYLVYSMDVGQLISLQTGGRNRILELSIEFFKDGLHPTAYNAAIYVANKNSPNELLYQSNLHSDTRYEYSRTAQFSLGSPCHGDTIFDIAFCETNATNEALLLSGSNDCTVKLHKVVHNGLSLVTELPPHESCIRAVASSKDISSNSSLLVVSGGKLISTFYRLDENRDGTFQVTFLCTNKIAEKSSIDQRMNAVDAIPLCGTGLVSHLVLLGDSDGCIHMTEVSEKIGQPCTVQSYKLYQGQRPILSIDMRRISDKFIAACIGNTGGEVALWVLPGLSEINVSFLPQAPLYSFKANQVGTNCISMDILPSNPMSSYNELMIACGGDDQSIAIFELQIDSYGKQASFLEMASIGRKYCASAIKGIKIKYPMVYATGYDQRLSIWSLNPVTVQSHDRLTFLSSSPIDIKDINCLDTCSFHDTNGISREFLVAAGEGIEMLSFDINICKASQALKNCDFLLVTVGAGFSSDSGLPTYETMPKSYKDFCDPIKLMKETEEFQRYWSQTSQKYAETKPHEGYDILGSWCGGGKLKNINSWWIYSSNVDGHFGLYDCFSDTICEIHGKATEFRCSHGIGVGANGESRYGWSEWNAKVNSSHITRACRELTFPDSAEALDVDKKIICKHCGVPVRPNILMFNDTDANILRPISKQRERYQEWEAKMEDEVQNGKKLVIIEIGAGAAVTAVRDEGEEVFKDCTERLRKNESDGEVTFIRINPKDFSFHYSQSEGFIPIKYNALRALRMIDQML